MRYLSCLILVFLMTAPALAEDWSMFKKDISHTGFTTDTVNPPLVLKWNSNLGYDTDSSPVIVDGVLYIGSNYGIHAIDTVSGKEIWKTQTNGFVKSVPTVVDGTLYVGADDKRFYALNTKDGSIKWINKNATDGYLSSAAIMDNVALAGSRDGTLYAIDIRTGEFSWIWPTGKDIESSPAVSGTTVYFGNYNGIVIALDAQNKKEVWRYGTGNVEIKSSPAVANGKVIIGSNNGNVYAFTDKGALKWTFSTKNNVESSPSVKDGTVFVGSKDTSFYAIDAETGKQKWSFAAAGFVESSPAVSNDIVFFGSRNNFIYALDANSGRLIWKKSIGTKEKDYITSPAISGNVLYVATHSGNVSAYVSEEPVQATQPAVPTVTPAIEPTKEKPPAAPAASPTVTPGETQSTPGFEYAALVLIIAFLIRRRRGSI